VTADAICIQDLAIKAPCFYGDGDGDGDGDEYPGLRMVFAVSRARVSFGARVRVRARPWLSASSVAVSRQPSP
jgi:hypothetical protein